MASVHPSMARLYEAVAALTGSRVGQSALAHRMNTSPQRVKNWEARGISQQGANQAQAEFGINANWLLDGAGDMLVNASPNRVRDESPHRLAYQSEPARLDPEIVYEALTLLKYDEEIGGAYTPRAQARRLAELFDWLVAEGGRLTAASNRTFVEQVATRSEGTGDDERRGAVRRKRAGIGRGG